MSTSFFASQLEHALADVLPNTDMVRIKPLLLHKTQGLIRQTRDNKTASNETRIILSNVYRDDYEMIRWIENKKKNPLDKGL